MPNKPINRRQKIPFNSIDMRNLTLDNDITMYHCKFNLLKLFQDWLID